MKKKFLALALTLVMVFAAVPVTAFADESGSDLASGKITDGSDVGKKANITSITSGGDDTSSSGTPAAPVTVDAAEAGGNKYSNLKDAIANANGAEIKLLTNISVNSTITVDAGKTAVINLDGHNITGYDTTGSSCHIIVNKGTLTIKGTGYVTAKGVNCAAIVNFPDATCTIEGGTYTSDWYVIKNMGKMTINGGTVTKEDKTDESSVIDNGWVSSSDTVAGETVSAQDKKAYLTINDGEVYGNGGTNSKAIIKNDDYGYLTINGGTFDSTANNKTAGATTILNWHEATIKGGTFKGSYVVSNAVADNDKNNGNITIEGGTFEGNSSLFGVAGNGTTKSEIGNFIIKDGTFTAPKLHEEKTSGGTEINLANYYKLSIKGGDFTTTPDVLKYVAENGDISLKLSSDVNGQIEVKEKTTVKLDLNGKTVSNDGGSYAILNHGNLTLTDTEGGGNITTSTVASVIKNKGSEGCEAKLTIESGEFTAKAGTNSCSVVMNDDWGILTINGGTFNSEANVNNDDAATLLNFNKATINGGTFKGQYPIANGYWKNDGETGVAGVGELTINDGTFIGSKYLFGQGKDNKFAGQASCTTTITGGTFTVADGGTFAKANVNLDGRNTNDESQPKNAEFYVIIKGGTFSSILKDAVSDHLASSKYKIKDVDETSFRVKKKSTSSENTSNTDSTSSTNTSTSAKENDNYDVNTGKADNGEIELSTNSIGKDYRVTATVTPDEGYELDKLVFTDKNGKEIDVEVIDNGDGTYSFFMPEGDIKVTPVFKEAGEEKEPEKEPTKIVMQIGNTDVTVGGSTIKNDTAPVIKNNRTLVPIRFISEALGGSVSWDDATKTVIISIDGKMIAMTIGRVLDAYGVAPEIINDRTYVPIRFIADELGVEIEWNGETQEIIITGKKDNFGKMDLNKF